MCLPPRSKRLLKLDIEASDYVALLALLEAAAYPRPISAEIYSYCRGGHNSAELPRRHG